MRKLVKLSGALLALLLPSALFAGGQVKTKIVSSDYSRNSVSNIVVIYGDRYDYDVVAGVNSFELGTKFDKNEIATKTIRLNGAFRTKSEQYDAAKTGKSNFFKDFFKAFSAGRGYNANKPDTLTQRLITEYLNDNNVGKEIFDYVLGVDAQGRFHYDLLVERSRWNATDEDVHLDEASQVKTMDENGPALLANSYIVVYDVKEPDYTTKSANVYAYVYMIDSAENVVADILGNMWIYDNDDEETKESKRAAYANVHIPMKCVAAVGVSSASDSWLSVLSHQAPPQSLIEAIRYSYDNILRKAETKIPAWKVVCGIQDVKPYISAKVGVKENIKNAQRFVIYGNKGDQDEGTFRTVKKGYARATVVNKNDTISTGETGVSYFYQISGVKLKGTEFMKQSNDIRLGLSVDYNYNGLGWKNQKVFGAFSMVDVSFDELVYMHRNGISQYTRINIGYDIITKSMLSPGNGIDYQKYNLNKGISFINISVGYMLGLRIKQVMEIQPMINIGFDIPIYHGLDMSSNKTRFGYGVFLDPGLRLVVNCGYPFQIFVQGDYSIMIYQETVYANLNSILSRSGNERTMGLGLAAGIKWTF